MNNTLIVASLALLAAPLHAAVFDVSELRLGYSTYLTDDLEGSATTGGASSAIDTSWDSSHRIFLDLVLGTSLPAVPFANVAYGVGIASDMREAEQSGVESNYQAWSGHVFAGPYLSFAMVRVELLPFVGFGSATLEQKAGGSSEDASGGYFEYGANLNAVIAPPAIPLVVGAGVGWLHNESEHDIGAAGSTTTYELDGGNWTVNGFVGYRF
jgi:hypothetical protein